MEGETSGIGQKRPADTGSNGHPNKRTKVLDDPDFGNEDVISALKEEIKQEIQDGTTNTSDSSNIVFGKVAKAMPSDPDLHINEFGKVSFPVNSASAGNIRTYFEQAPYGLGEDTILDVNVRKSFQMSPDKFEIKNEAFVASVNDLVEVVKKGLGCGEVNVEAKLYKLLLYEPGGFFRPHRDTEKADGMFGTLIVQLPSKFTGGNLIVSHKGTKKIVRFSQPKAETKCMYAAHYADCEHELTEILTGYRVALVYSLCWDGNGLLPCPDNAIEKVPQLTYLLRRLLKVSEPDMRLIWALDHEYSLNALKLRGIRALKGNDKHVASSIRTGLSKLTGDDKMAFYIVKVTKTEHEYGECTDYDRGRYGYWGRRGRWGYDSDEHGTECFDSAGCDDWDIELEDYIEMDGSVAYHSINNMSVNVEDGEVLNVDEDGELFDGEPVNGECSGPSGNEGSTRDRWYYKYIIIMWRKKNFLNILCRNNDIKAAVDHVKKSHSEIPSLLKVVSSEPTKWLGADSFKEFLNLAINVNDVETSKSLLKLLLTHKEEIRYYGWRDNNRIKGPYCFGRSLEMPKAIAACISKFKWDTVKKEIVDILDVLPSNQLDVAVKFADSCPEDAKSDVLSKICEKWATWANDESLNNSPQAVKELIAFMFKHADLCDEHLNKLPGLKLMQKIGMLSNVLKHLSSGENFKFEESIPLKKLLDLLTELMQQSGSDLRSDIVGGVIDIFLSFSKDHLATIIAVLKKVTPRDDMVRMIMNKVNMPTMDAEKRNMLVALFVEMCQNFFKMRNVKSDLISSAIDVVMKQKEDSLLSIVTIVVNSAAEETSMNMILEKLKKTMTVNIRTIFLDCLVMVCQKSFQKPNVKSNLVADAVGMFLKHRKESLKNLLPIIVNSSPGEDVLKLIIEKVKTSMAAKTKEMFQPLVKERTKQLRLTVAKGKPEFTWEQPYASFRDVPAIQNFLRGPKQKYMHRDFGSVITARKWSDRYFNTINGKPRPTYHLSSNSNSKKSYYVTAEAGGIGKRSYVEITKTREGYDQTVAHFERCRTEFKDLCSMFGLSEVTELQPERTSNQANLGLTSSVQSPSLSHRNMAQSGQTGFGVSSNSNNSNNTPARNNAASNQSTVSKELTAEMKAYISRYNASTYFPSSSSGPVHSGQNLSHASSPRFPSSTLGKMVSNAANSVSKPTLQTSTVAAATVRPLGQIQNTPGKGLNSNQQHASDQSPSHRNMAQSGQTGFGVSYNSNNSNNTPARNNAASNQSTVSKELTAEMNAYISRYNASTYFPSSSSGPVHSGQNSSHASSPRFPSSTVGKMVSNAANSVSKPTVQMSTAAATTARPLGQIQNTPGKGLNSNQQHLSNKLAGGTNQNSLVSSAFQPIKTSSSSQLIYTAAMPNAAPQRSISTANQLETPVTSSVNRMPAHQLAFPSGVSVPALVLPQHVSVANRLPYQNMPTPAAPGQRTEQSLMLVSGNPVLLQSNQGNAYVDLTQTGNSARPPAYVDLTGIALNNDRK